MGDRLQLWMTFPRRRRAALVARAMLQLFLPFTLAILLALLVDGPEQQQGREFVRVDLLFFTYSTGAALAGAIVGCWLPATRNVWSAILVGVVAFLPWSVGIDLAIDHGYAHWTTAHTAMSAIFTLLFGPALGYGFFAASKLKAGPKRTRHIAPTLPNDR